MKDNNGLYSSIILHNEMLRFPSQNYKIRGNTLKEEIKEIKFAIMRGRMDSFPAEFVSPELIASWRRSREYGLETSKFPDPPILEPSVLADLQEERKLLLQAALSSEIGFPHGLAETHSFFMTDSQGIMLMVQPAEKQRESLNALGILPGTMWNEKTVGTTEIALCLALKRPVQICGPEYFSEAFESHAGCAAPILNFNGDLTGVFAIHDIRQQNMTTQLFNLCISIAGLIEKEYQLAIYKKLHDDIYASNDESKDDLLLITDINGSIIRVNQAANNLFAKVYKETNGLSIETVFRNYPKIKSSILAGVESYEDNVNIKGLGIRTCSVQCLNDDLGKRFGSIIQLKARESIMAAVPENNSLEKGFTFDSIVGESAQIIKAKSITKKFAKLDVNILLQGESGTGKDVFAQAIHNAYRPDGPFMAVNCGAIPQTLIESELFGYEGGAFTGAGRSGRSGKIEQANGGTLFLDEIGDMPLESQPVLLRVLEEKKIVRIGGKQAIPVDFKLIAASNKDLLNLVANKQFREDLYYRLTAFKIVIPPLREREEDIINLVNYFISTVAASQGIPKPSLRSDAKYCLMEYSWPGNVRELKNAIIYAVNMSGDGKIKSEDLPLELRSSVSFSAATGHNGTKSLNQKHKNQDIERVSIEKALHDTGHNINKAAKLLGISRSTLYRKLQKYQL